MGSSIFEDSVPSAKKAGYKILSYRDHTSHEMTQKLARKGFSEKTISKTVLFFKQFKLINDQKYARAWSQYRIEQDYFGPIRIRKELLKKGLPSTEVSTLIHDLSGQYNLSHQAESVLVRRYKNLETLQTPKYRRRAYDFLRRKGYPGETIMTVFRKIGALAE